MTSLLNLAVKIIAIFAGLVVILGLSTTIQTPSTEIETEQGKIIQPSKSSSENSDNISNQTAEKNSLSGKSPASRTEKAKPKTPVPPPVVTPKTQTETEYDILNGSSPTPVGTIAPETISIKPSFSELNEKARLALVNIICTPRLSDPFIKAISGSGVIIDSRGVILTNAHLAEYFLLKDYKILDAIECFIRTGNPARSRYKAELSFISPSWISKNTRNLKVETPIGTGEFDYALLKITSSIDGKPLPNEFTSIPPELHENTSQEGEEVLLAAYPAGFLGSYSIERDLFAASSVANIADVFTFAEQTIDLVSLSGNVVAQRGSSGGATITSNGKLLGIFVTSTQGKTTSERTLRAITLPYINRMLKQEWGKTIPEFMASDLVAETKKFQETLAPDLINTLYTALKPD